MTISLPLPPPVIAFTGGYGSGKTTAAAWLLANVENVVRLSFASPIKNMTAALLTDAAAEVRKPVHERWATDPALKNAPIPHLGGVTARRIMQTLGTEWGRQIIGEDLWVDIMANKIERLHADKLRANQSLKMVVDDLRFENEARMIRRYGGQIVRIVRPDAPNDPAVSGHASEGGNVEADITVVNDGTLEDLHARLAGLWALTPRKPRA